MTAAIIAALLAAALLSLPVWSTRHLWAARYAVRGRHRTGVAVRRLLVARRVIRSHRHPAYRPRVWRLA